MSSADIKSSAVYIHLRKAIIIFSPSLIDELIQNV